jgi:hypothetical protein
LGGLKHDSRNRLRAVGESLIHLALMMAGSNGVTKMAMDSYTATMIAEGVEDADEDRQIEAWQHLIDTGLCWRLQGWFGRQAAAMIDAGICAPADRNALPKVA